MPSRRTIQVFDRQRKIRFNLPWLRRFASLALAACEGEGIALGAPLESLEEIEVSIVSDDVIDGVHRQFMNIPGPTDVITFEHGEIVIGAGVAARQSKEHAKPLDHELGLYIIHGLLHLNAHDDIAEPAASRMRNTQSALLRKVLSQIGKDTKSH